MLFKINISLILQIYSNLMLTKRVLIKTKKRKANSLVITLSFCQILKVRLTQLFTGRLDFFERIISNQTKEAIYLKIEEIFNPKKKKFEWNVIDESPRSF